MSAPQFTPGPWINGLDDIDCIWSDSAGGEGNVVCLPPDPLQARSIERWPANARLIAAAPEPYDVLAEADRRIAWESLGLGNTFAERVESTLAKARGDQ